MARVGVRRPSQAATQESTKMVFIAKSQDPKSRIEQHFHRRRYHLNTDKGMFDLPVKIGDGVTQTTALQKDVLWQCKQTAKVSILF